MKPLYMWAGGKTKMMKNYLPYLPYKFSTYIEPFFGGGSMFIWAYQTQPDASFVINDINPSLINIYQVIKTDCDKFIEEMDRLQAAYLPLDKDARKEYYYNLRHQHAYDYGGWSKTQEAATLYFLMRTGFNGVWQINQNTNHRFGTPCGLLNQTDSVYDKENVLEWHQALQRTTILCGDFTGVDAYVDEGSFVFMDPPYRDSFTQYGVDFNDGEQIRVLDVMHNWAKRRSNVCLTNRNAGDGFWEREAQDKRGFKIHQFPVTYTAGRRKRTENGFEAKSATEVLIAQLGIGS